MLDLLNPFINISVGTILLLLGHHVFWLFTAAIGFVYGFSSMVSMFPDMKLTYLSVSGGVCATFGAVLGMTMKTIACIIAGILGGGLIATHVYPVFLQIPETTDWIIYTIGAVIGGIFAIVSFNWLVIVFSAIIGAMYIFIIFYDGSLQHILGFAGTVLISIVLQGFLYVRGLEKDGLQLD